MDQQRSHIKKTPLTSLNSVPEIALLIQPQIPPQLRVTMKQARPYHRSVGSQGMKIISKSFQKAKSKKCITSTSWINHIQLFQISVIQNAQKLSKLLVLQLKTEKKKNKEGKNKGKEKREEAELLLTDLSPGGLPTHNSSPITEERTRCPCSAKCPSDLQGILLFTPCLKIPRLADSVSFSQKG